MTPRRLIGAVGAVSVVVVAVVVLTSPYRYDKGQLHALAPVIGASFIGTGLFAWRRRPENRTGILMLTVGFAWLGASLIAAEQAGVYIFGWIFYSLPYVILIHLLLAFPSGRLEGLAQKVVVGAGYGVGVGTQLPLVLVFDPSQPCDCALPNRPNPLLVTSSPTLFDVLSIVQTAVSIGALLVAGVLLTARYRGAAARQRHVLQPVLGAGIVIVVSITLTLIADVTRLSNDFEDVVDVISRLMIAAVPFAFLAGLARSRFTRLQSVASLAEALEGRPLRDALAAALGDPSLRLAYAMGDGFVDDRGRRLTDLGSHTLVERGGRPVGALLHEPELAEEDPESLRAAAAAAALAMENARLPARLVQAADAERRRLERDLHDGAQQRLVSLALTLRLARTKAGPELEPLLAEAADELQHATNELRELARGIHPAVLTDRGLGPALTALADRAGVPVELDGVPEERMARDVESAAYFVVAEALTNVDRYARAQAATVSVARVNGHLRVEVSDDGVGGADPSAGTGLRGLADRVAAIDGTLEVTSPPGAGTTVRAELPCAS